MCLTLFSSSGYRTSGEVELEAEGSGMANESMPCELDGEEYGSNVESFLSLLVTPNESGGGDRRFSGENGSGTGSGTDGSGGQVTQVSGEACCIR